MLELPEPQDICLGKLHTGNRKSSSEKSVLQLAKLEGQSCLMLLKSGIELQGLEFALLNLGFALVQYFFTVSPTLRFGMVMYILCHCILKICNFFSLYRD